MKLNKICAGLGLGVAASCLMALAPIAHADSFTKALTGGTPSGDIRIRYENADDGNAATKDADAFTVRTRLGYRTGDFNGFTAFVEMEDTSSIGDEDYNDGTTSGDGTYATVADPQGTEMNRADITYKGISDTAIIVGRQRIIYDNARFIGNVGWRQNEQTYDGLTIKNTSVKDLKLGYNYISDVNTIKFGNDAMDGHLFNVSYSGLGIGTITGYGYLLDYDAAASTDLKTFGVRFSGGAEIGSGMKLLYTAEFADQSDYKDSSSATVDAEYMLVEGGIGMGPMTAKIGYEELGQDGTHNSFSTPLATKHAHNGWADKFLGTPSDGLEDTYLKISAKMMGVKMMMVYHDYEANNSGNDYGDELNLLAVKKYGKNYAVGVKYASYDASNVAYKDTDKLMLWGQIKF
jgi:hypothetical protein